MRLLSSFPQPRPTTNPYIVQLHQQLSSRDDVLAAPFTWRHALLGGFDVFHMHWPEILVDGSSPLKKAARQLFFALLLMKIRLLRVAVVRTVHNLELPAGISRREKFLLRFADSTVTLRIALSEHTQLPPGQAFLVIPHGHYRDWFAAYPQPAAEDGRVVFFGLVRRYKSIDDLIRAFRDVGPDSGVRALRIAGQPTSEELRAELLQLTGDDPRISTRFEFLDDAGVVDEVGRAEFVALPYREMHNSGAALTALSLSRPVLVRDNGLNRALRDEVGAHWVHLFDDVVGADDLEKALAAVRADPPRGEPDLSRRDWAASATAHVEAYRRAVRLRRGS
ncbi:glycosyltransferase [uncultured Jatrophihabitans sp.]|uniref:glycosyltransferase n=1 Tax=uncultured Jatrophihabitans sp. TaxID=1610747 RepID=UPI0035CA9FA8